MYALRKMIVVDTKNLFKNKAWLLLGIFLSIILVALLGFITKPLYGSIMSSYDFYGVTVFFFLTANGATFSANAFLE
jgi:ABC-2 type transport system permease protein